MDAIVLGIDFLQHLDAQLRIGQQLLSLPIPVKTPVKSCKMTPLPTKIPVAD